VKVPGLNFQELLRRLGVQAQGWAPEMVNAVFPVVLAQDASALVPPLRPRAAWCGGQTPVTVEPASVATIQNLSPGGLWVRWLAIQTTNASLALFYIGDGSLYEPPVDNPTIFNFNVATALRMSPDPIGAPIASRLLLGDGPAVALSAIDHPTHNFTAGQLRTWPYGFWLEPGDILQIEFDNPNVAARIECILEEVPAPPGAA